MKKIVSSLLALSMLFGGISIVSAEGNTPAHQKTDKAAKEEKAQQRLEKQQSKAAKLEIEVAGKTDQEIKAALKAAQTKKKQEHLTKLTKKATLLGIDTAGKTAKQMKEEIQAKKAENKAGKQSEKKKKQ